MSAGALHTWIKRHITVRQRLGRICTASLLFVAHSAPLWNLLILF
jgi:hypothetical protein